MFFLKSDIKKKKSPRQGSWPQKSGLGMHQNPHFQLNPLKNQKNPEINPLTGRRRKTLFPSLLLFQPTHVNKCGS